MVKTVALLLARRAVVVLLLELAAVVLACVAFGLWFGAPSVCCVLAVACLVKAFELDLLSEPRSR